MPCTAQNGTEDANTYTQTANTHTHMYRGALLWHASQPFAHLHSRVSRPATRGEKTSLLPSLRPSHSLTASLGDGCVPPSLNRCLIQLKRVIHQHVASSRERIASHGNGYIAFLLSRVSLTLQTLPAHSTCMTHVHQTAKRGRQEDTFYDSSCKADH